MLCRSSFPEQVPGWIEGRYGMSFSMASTASATINDSPFELGTLYSPVLEGAKNSAWPTTASMMYALSANSENLQEAAKFINYLINDEDAIRITKDTRGIPSNRKAAEMLLEAGSLSTLMLEINSKSAELGTNIENGPSLDTELDAINEEFVQSVAYMQMTPEEAAMEYIREIERWIASK